MVKPDVTFGEARKMTDRIHTMGEWTEDNGLTFFGIHPPLSIGSKRVLVKFAEDGGTDRDGLIYIRPDVKDVSMGKNAYSQVRIMVDKSHFIKGVAVYSKDMPDGTDIVVFSNKKREVGTLGALKELKPDADNPFGSVIKRQIVETDPKTGKDKVTSAVNLLREEGDWQDWRNSIPSQVLAKQPRSLIKSQLEVTRDQVNDRLTEIGKSPIPSFVRRNTLTLLIRSTQTPSIFVQPPCPIRELQSFSLCPSSTLLRSTPLSSPPEIRLS